MRWPFSPKPDLAVESAEDADMPALADIHEAGFPQPWDAEAIAGLGSQPGVTIWVARIAAGGRQPVGFALVRSVAGEAEIITIATDAAHRRQGVARTLMDHAIRELQRERVERLFLEVSERNLAAVELYRRLGFRQVARRDGYYRPREEDEPSAGALVMELDLR